MIVTPESNQQNRNGAFMTAALIVGLSIALCFVSPWWGLGILVGLFVYFGMRRETLSRLKRMAEPFPESWQAILVSDVVFYRSLTPEQQLRFQNLVKIFLSEARITGVRTDVDERTRVLVAASAIIPVFGFDDWEYSGLGEVLIYPNAFGEGFRSDDDAKRNILGMVGTGHLSGVMILSKSDLISGFTNPDDKRNVGIHEFAHLVDKADGSIDGIPAGISASVVGPWIGWIGEELKSTSKGRSHINDYAYTNEAEYFAVLTEYFFEAPDVLQRKNPELYKLMQSMYRQDTRGFLSTTQRRHRVGRNSPCPCGSGEKFKRCCRRKAKKRVA
ncbi:MAG: zinc-dependent peptidase [Rubripirellula sp.]|nr:zinc-dependent peptidase [Rubripirellula sp.]